MKLRYLQLDPVLVSISSSSLKIEALALQGHFTRDTDWSKLLPVAPSLRRLKIYEQCVSGDQAGIHLFENLSAMTELQDIDLNFRRCDYDEVLHAIAVLPYLQWVSFLFWDTSAVFHSNSVDSLLDSMICLTGLLRLSHCPSRCSMTDLKLTYVDIDLGILCP